MANIIRLKDLNLNKHHLDSWKTGKICCPNVGCEGKILEANGIRQHYCIVHHMTTCQNSDIEENIIAGKKLLRCLVAEETMKNLKLLSDARMKQVRIVVK